MTLLSETSYPDFSINTSLTSTHLEKESQIIVQNHLFSLFLVLQGIYQYYIFANKVNPLS